MDLEESQSWAKSLSYHKIHDIISSSTAFYASATQVHLSNQNKNSWSEVEELSGPERNPYFHIQVSACVRDLITDEVLWGEDSNFTTIHGENWCRIFWQLIRLICFWRKFQLMVSALDNSFLSSDQDTNRFLVLAELLIIWERYKLV